jgi:hypothetical protein
MLHIVNVDGTDPEGNVTTDAVLPLIAQTVPAEPYMLVSHEVEKPLPLIVA